MSKSKWKLVAQPFEIQNPRMKYLWHLIRWRDMPIKLITFLSGGIWLSRLDQFGDPLEGSMPKRNLGLMEKLLGSRQLAASIEEQYRSASRNAYASCWHMSDGDPSNKMWQKFAGHKGIAIRTDAATLQEQLGAVVIQKGPGYISEVKYIDHSEDCIPEAQTLAAAFCVQRKYAFQQEARILVNAYGAAAFETLLVMKNAWGERLVQCVRATSESGNNRELRGHIPVSAGPASHWFDGLALVPEIEPSRLIHEVLVGHRTTAEQRDQLARLLDGGPLSDRIRIATKPASIKIE
jgi:hypothetical protein